ncbi:hypothetical protein FH039_04910 [Thermococcus indicus]|uniref:Uncharacterized protein n=1 Tax=Thermococcus indicus TaxID=2586643 RepID=A0A4Y5SJH6_9EURY|nr:hypothetical protein [Thermococcus indicus]QDA31077.1 hypothetical protein FH039_04910 [Thermococcus indicus]
MNSPSRVFKFSLLINILIILYSAYQVKVNDSEWWGYTFIGIFLWTVGIILVAPPDKTPKWYRVDKLLNYPLISLVIFIALFYSSGLFDFLLRAIILSGVGELLTYILQRKLSRSVVMAYYSMLVILAWVHLYEYPLIPLAYCSFVIYCAINLLRVINDQKETMTVQ